MGIQMEFSDSRVQKYLTCSSAFEKYYIEGIREEVLAANLLFGKVVHKTWQGWLRAWHAGTTSDWGDITRNFLEYFDEGVENNAVSYNTRDTEASLRAMGKAMCDVFPEYWESTGLILAEDEQGPIIERHLRMKIGEVPFQGFVDLIAHDEDGRTIVPDLKILAPSSQASSEFAMLADQLTAYNILVDTNLDQLGLAPVSRLGYIEGVKLKTPRINPPLLVPARHEALKQEYMRKVLWVDAQVKARAFFHEAGGSYNTPCKMCDYQGLCTTGSMDGLVVTSLKKAA